MSFEVWRDVSEFPDLFQVSNKGRVWSKRTNKVLSQTTGKTGYKVISTKIGGRSGKSVCRKVHRWVAFEFVPNTDDKPYVNHKDGNKLNNSAENLEWCTAKENTSHAWSTGLIDESSIRRGFENEQSNLDEDDLFYIRCVYTPRHKMFGARALARELSVNKNTILSAVKYNSYSGCQ